MLYRTNLQVYINWFKFESWTDMDLVFDQITNVVYNQNWEVLVALLLLLKFSSCTDPSTELISLFANKIL